MTAGLSLEQARAAVSGARAWIITDGKAGDVAQCLGVAERLGLKADERVIAPRALFAALLPYGPIDPREKPGREGGPLAGPLPDIVIASGRRAAAYVKAVKRVSAGKTFTAILKDPRLGPRAADFFWVPRHDRLRGPNVLTTLTSPHRLSPERLAEARTNLDPAFASLIAGRGGGARKIAVLIGGESKNHRFTDEDISRFCAALAKLAADGAFLLGTLSRRTPPKLGKQVSEIFAKAGGYLYQNSGPNPYATLVALADAFVITADSVNMLGEAAATGKGIHVFEPSGGSRKTRAFLNGLERAGATRPFTGAVEFFTYPPIDSTPEIAAALVSRFRNPLHAISRSERISESKGH